MEKENFITAEKSGSEKITEKIEQLSSALAPYLDKKVNLYHSFNAYGLALLDESEQSMIVDPSTDSELSEALGYVYSRYLDATRDTLSERKYDIAAIDPKTNSTNPEILRASSFILNDFLEAVKAVQK